MQKWCIILLLFIYLHIVRDIYYNSSCVKEIWNIGVTIFIITVATAFIGSLYISWRWRNLVILIYTSFSGRRDVRQENVNILHHLQSDRRSGSNTKLFLNLLIRFHLDNLPNLHQLTSHSTTSCPTTWRSYRDYRLLWRWRHFTLCISWQYCWKSNHELSTMHPVL